MRRFLYISPFFPPMTRVGALRPLKFARRLPEFGWAPVVLCDLRDHEDCDERLAAAVPESTIVIRDYSRHAALARPRPRARDSAPSEPSKPSKPGWFSRHAEDINPLGAHAFGMRHAFVAARAALEAHPSCEAIMVNADPYAALLVGARLARATGLPLIQDLRDPWACCDLRRPLRPAPQRWLVDRVERRAVEAARVVVLNTETARDDYRRHYADLPADRFACIRNHADPALHVDVEFPAFDRFTILFMGNFRRFVEGTTLVDALARVRAAGLAGHGSDRVQLVVTGSIPAELRARAEAAGVADMLVAHRFVPYLEVASLMGRADLLLSFSHPTAQRIPAKIFDYLLSDRPLLVIADNPELARLVERAGGASVHGLQQVDAIAATIVAELARGRGRRVERAEVGVDSVTASRELAGILDRVTLDRGERHGHSRR
ncbi:hypothetical protein ACNOYE_11755 [Nannocystaceae bacterium ST9]